ncbi:MAG: prepilin-type N-terminal cleavage/methylation domain-containing protein [Phycisphaerae bacterium]|nr:prepilin-type N-terminal cleavage/methylation domain-containing protein [Phycisphaerae bacterium]
MNETTHTADPAAIRRGAFTLIELLIVVSVISILTAILAPGLNGVKKWARSVSCTSNLHDLGVGMSVYHHENDDRFWPYLLDDRPTQGKRCYWWGTDDDPVDPMASPYMTTVDGMLEMLWCPSMPWGSYVPQGWYVSEPTTTYGYNAYSLDPGLNGQGTTSLADIPRPSGLFVFNDSAMFWRVGGRGLFQNSTYLEPVSGNWVQQPTSHFRHKGKTNALTADGHAASYEPRDWNLDPTHNLGFVGKKNSPHYAQ